MTDRSLVGLGTDESVWLGCAELGHLDRGPVVLLDSGRVVVVAPHPEIKARRIELDDATARREREAVGCFTSQLTGPEPILSRSTVRRLRRDFEVFVAP